jgi:hypothetical protein
MQERKERGLPWASVEKASLGCGEFCALQLRACGMAGRAGPARPWLDPE